MTETETETETDTDPEATIPERLGSYEIEDLLGEGGMGVVYRARHSQTRTEVALKTVRHAHARQLTTLRSEIRALARLSHPGIVRVLDHGVGEDGNPWFAMELLPGSTLADAFWFSPEEHSSQASSSSVGSDPEAETAVVEGNPAASARSASASRSAPSRTKGGGGLQKSAGSGHLSKRLTVLRRICAPLAFLHGEGLVHCDLKPSNVFLRADGSPVIGDLGLAARVSEVQGRDVLEVATEIRGTVSYMSPEQIRLERIDARADLYALGCMLFEAVTERPPFLGEPTDILRSHLTETPPRVSELASDVPPGLDALIARLLAKYPRERIGFATDVARMLAPFCEEQEELEPDALPLARAYLYRSELVGREREMGQLRRMIESASAGKGAFSFLSGESGIGKTRLGSELGRLAASLGFLVIVGRCSESSSSAPLETFTPLLKWVGDRCREKGVEETTRLVGDRIAVLAPYERTLHGLPGTRGLAPPARLEPAAARLRLFSALYDTVTALGSTQPLFLVLEDLHWADELTLAFLSFLADRVANHRLCVLGTYRSDELKPELEALVRGADVLRVELTRLPAESVSSMVGDMLAWDTPPSGFVSFLSRESEGNPFFVAEYLRTAFDEEMLHRDDEGRWQLASFYQVSDASFTTLPLPTTLRKLVGLRFEGLSDESSRMAELAAVLGRELDARALEAAVGLDRDDAADAALELLQRHVLEPASPERFRFVHHKLQEIAYERIEDEHLPELHRRAADALSALSGDETPLARHLELARHWSLGRRPADAARNYRAAAELAAEIYANAQALECYRLALEELERVSEDDTPADAELSEIEEKMGDLFGLTGKQADARLHYERALELARAGGTLSRARLNEKLGKSWETHHEHDKALSLYDRAAEILGDDPFEPEALWRASWVQLRLDRAWVHYWRGNADLMQGELEAVRPFAKSPLERARFFELLANLGHRRERYLASAETVAHSREAAVASQETGDPVQIAQSLFELGFAQLFHGDSEAAAETLESALEEAKRIGDITRQARCLTYLTLSFRRSRLMDLAELRARQSLESARESGIPVYLGTSLANLGWLDFHAQRYAESEERCLTALDTWKRADIDFPFVWIAAFPLVAIRFGRGDVKGSLEHAEALLKPSKQRLPAELANDLEAAVEAGRAGREARARESLRQALKLAEKMGYL